MRRSQHANSRGFTLVEIAIVVVIIGLLLSGALLTVTPVLESARRTETEAKMDIIEDALIVYAIQYNCIPCPANRADIGGANAGLASQTGGTGNYSQAFNTIPCASTGQTCDMTDNNGIIPWRNLGIQQTDALDGFGNYFNYYVAAADTAVFQDDGNAADGTDGSLERGSGTPPSYPAGSQTVQGTGGATTITSQAAYVLISSGQDSDEAVNSGGGLNADAYNVAGTTDPDQDENTDGDTTFIQRLTTSTNTANYYDDIVRFKTAPLIIQQCGSGACGNP